MSRWVWRIRKISLLLELVDKTSKVTGLRFRNDSRTYYAVYVF